MTDKHLAQASIGAFLLFKNANGTVLRLSVDLKQRRSGYPRSLWLSCMTKTFPLSMSTSSIFITKVEFIKIQPSEISVWFVREWLAEFPGGSNTTILRPFWLWLIGFARYEVHRFDNRLPNFFSGRLILNDKGV